MDLHAEMSSEQPNANATIPRTTKSELRHIQKPKCFDDCQRSPLGSNPEQFGRERLPLPDEDHSGKCPDSVPRSFYLGYEMSLERVRRETGLVYSDETHLDRIWRSKCGFPAD